MSATLAWPDGGRGGTDWLWRTERPRGRERRRSRNRVRVVCCERTRTYTHTHALVHHRPLAISLVTLLHAAFRRTAWTARPSPPLLLWNMHCAWIVEPSNTHIVLLACNKTCTLKKTQANTAARYICSFQTQAYTHTHTYTTIYEHLHTHTHSKVFCCRCLYCCSQQMTSNGFHYFDDVTPLTLNK